MSGLCRASGWNRLPSRLASSSYCRYFSVTAVCAMASSVSASSGRVLGERTVAKFVVGIGLQRNARTRRVEAERILADGAHHRVEAEQRPISAGRRQVLLLHAEAHIDAVRDAVAVGKNQRWPGIRLGLAKRLQRVLRIGTHRHLGDIDVAIGDRLQREVLARRPLARGGELRHGAERRRLRSLAAGVGIDLGVEHQNIDVARAGEHVIEAAVADIVSPSVTADDPDAAPDQMIDDRQQIERERFLDPQQPGLQLRDPDPLRADVGLLDLWCLGDRLGELRPDLVREAGQQRQRQRKMLVGREPEAKPELGVVLEQRIRPCRPAAFGILCPGRDGQVAAVDRGAAGGIGDLQPVAEQLAQQLEIRRLAAAAAGAGKLEQRLQELHAADIGEIHPRAIVHRQAFRRTRYWRAPSVSSGSLSAMLIAFTSASRGLVSGQASTQRPHPVQSST